MTNPIVERRLDEFVNAFYYAGQSVIGQNDGGIAGLFESGEECKNSIIRPLLLKIVAAIGEVEFAAEAGAVWAGVDNWRVSQKLGDLSELHDRDVTELARAAVGHLFLRVGDAFPSLDRSVLDTSRSSAVLFMEGYLKYERSFVDDPTAAPTL